MDFRARRSASFELALTRTSHSDLGKKCRQKCFKAQMNLLRF